MFGALLGLSTGVINNTWAEQRENNARRQNFFYNEMSAQNADKRTRALYNDFYSPSAQLRMIREAGLSPSLFFGGQGASGMSAQPNGAQGGGVNGISPNMHFIDPLTAAQIENINADTASKKENTKGQSILNDIKDMEKQIFEHEFNFLHGMIWNDDGTSNSLAEIANTCDNFDAFIKKCRKISIAGGNNGDFNNKQVQILQDYYNTYKRLNTEIEKLKFNEEDAKFNKSVINALENINYSNLNAQQVQAQLNSIIEQANLDAEQKKAWNNVINSIENENTRAIVIVISMILDRMASVYRTTPNITMNKNRQIRSYE